MIATLLARIAASPWARAALRYGILALTVLLFLLSIRRAGERAGRLAERLETIMEKANDVQRQMLDAAARRPRDRDELDLLPEGSAIAEMLADYSVMRDQARACTRTWRRLTVICAQTRPWPLKAGVGRISRSVSKNGCIRWRGGVSDREYLARLIPDPDMPRIFTTGRTSTSRAADLVGSERVRRHPHRRD